MVLGTEVMGRNWPQPVLGVPAPALGWAAARPAQKPNLKQRKGNDTSYLMAIAQMRLGKFPQPLYQSGSLKKCLWLLSGN